MVMADSMATSMSRNMIHCLRLEVDGSIVDEIEGFIVPLLEQRDMLSNAVYDVANAIEVRMEEIEHDSEEYRFLELVLGNLP
jgi:hypothetical protein